MSTDTGAQVEGVRFSSYGRVFGMYAGDMNGDGNVDTTDNTLYGGLSGYDVRGDMDRDGDNQADDQAALQANYGKNLGWGKLSYGTAAGGNRRGYAGYEFDPVAAWNQFHVRHRVLNADLGRWISRDPLQYNDGPSLSQYIRSNPSRSTDPFGLADWIYGCGELFVDESCRCKAVPGPGPTLTNPLCGDIRKWKYLPEDGDEIEPLPIPGPDEVCADGIYLPGGGIIKIPNNCWCTIYCIDDGSGIISNISCTCQGIWWFIPEPEYYPPGSRPRGWPPNNLPGPPPNHIPFIPWTRPGDANPPFEAGVATP